MKMIAYEGEFVTVNERKRAYLRRILPENAADALDSPGMSVYRLP